MNAKLRLPAVITKFLQPMSVSAEEFFRQWRSLAGPPLKLQEVVNLFSTQLLSLVTLCFIMLRNLYNVLTWIKDKARWDWMNFV